MCRRHNILLTPHKRDSAQCGARKINVWYACRRYATWHDLRRIILLGIILWMLVPLLPAQPLSLDSCKSMALRNNATVKNTALDVLVARQVRQQVLTMLLWCMFPPIMFLTVCSAVRMFKPTAPPRCRYPAKPNWQENWPCNIAVVAE